MRRISILLAALMLGGALAPAASARRESGLRSETQEYVVQGTRTHHHWDDDLQSNYDAPPLVFQPQRGERTVALSAEDASGRMIDVIVTQEAAKGGKDLELNFCGTWQVFELVSRKPVHVHVFHGLCRNHNWSFASTGTVTLTFSKDPLDH